MALQFNSGELATRIRRFLGTRGRTDLGLDETVVPTVVMQLQDRAPFRNSGYQAHRHINAPVGVGLSSAVIDNLRGGGPVVVETVGLAALAGAAVKVFYGIPNAIPNSIPGTLPFLSGERGAAPVFGVSFDLLATSVALGTANQPASLFPGGQIMGVSAVAGNSIQQPDIFELTIPKGFFLYFEASIAAVGFDLAVRVRVYDDVLGK